MQDQTITFHWRTFEEETPQPEKDILVENPSFSPVLVDTHCSLR